MTTPDASKRSTTRHTLWLFSCAALLTSLATNAVGSAHAQIKSPGRHAHYDAELEPHLVFQWADDPFWDDDGIGLGFRASIPLIEDGPVKTINNNMAISFGLDWAHFDNCGRWDTDLCGADDFWIPVVVQWNFFLSDVVSLFPELGLGIQHSRWNWDGYNPAGCNRIDGRNVCSDGTDTDIELVLWLGARFNVSEDIALTLRLGVPSLLFGVSFML
jgi:hypothetical protein